VIDTRIGKTNAAFSLTLCGYKTRAFKHCKAVNFCFRFCFDPHLWSWILGTNWRYRVYYLK